MFLIFNLPSFEIRHAFSPFDRYLANFVSYLKAGIKKLLRFCELNLPGMGLTFSDANFFSRL